MGEAYNNTQQATSSNHTEAEAWAACSAQRPATRLSPRGAAPLRACPPAPPPGIMVCDANTDNSINHINVDATANHTTGNTNNDSCDHDTRNHNNSTTIKVISRTFAPNISNQESSQHIAEVCLDPFPANSWPRQARRGGPAMKVGLTTTFVLNHNFFVR